MIVVSFGWVAGCGSRPASPQLIGHSLATSRTLPTGDIEGFFPPAKWRTLRDLEFAGYVRMEAEIRADGSVRVGRVVERFPDSAWDLPAVAYGGEVVLRAATAGSGLSPKAEIWAVFFKPSIDGRLALIFGRQVGPPNPGAERPAMYLHTRKS